MPTDKKEKAKKVVEVAKRRMKSKDYVKVPKELQEIAHARGEGAYSCIGGVCTVLKEAGVMEDVNWSNTDFALKAKDYGFPNNGYGVKGLKNLEPGDVLQHLNDKNNQGNYYPGHSQIFVEVNEEGDYVFFDNYREEPKIYKKDELEHKLDPKRKKTEQSASIYKVNDYEAPKAAEMSPEAKADIATRQSLKDYNAYIPSNYKYKIRDDAKDYNEDTKPMMDRFVDFSNDDKNINDLVEKTGKSKEEIHDSLLNVFGELGQENKWQNRTFAGSGLGLEGVFEKVFKPKKRSIGPGQIKFNSLSEEDKKKFGIEKPKDLFNVDKIIPLMAALDLKDKQVLKNWGEKGTLATKLIGSSEPLKAEELKGGVGRWSPYLRNQYGSINNKTRVINNDDGIPFNTKTAPNWEAGKEGLYNPYTLGEGSYPDKVIKNIDNNLERTLINPEGENNAIMLPQATVKSKKMKKGGKVECAECDKSLKKGGKLKKAEFGMYEDEPAKLQRIDNAAVQPISSASLAPPTAKVDTNNLGSQHRGAKESVAASESKDKNKMGIPRPKPIALGPMIQGGLGLINALLPKDQPRTFIDNTLAYNPYPQGTGSQALFEEGGVVLSEDPKPKKSKASRQANSDIIPDAGYENRMNYSGVIDGNGKVIENPSHAQWLETMVKYANNNIPESNVYRQNFQHHSINLNTPPTPNDLPTFARNGAKIQAVKATGLEVHEGGSAPELSYNPIDGGMGEFKGASHADDGITATYNGKPFEAEGGEPYRVDSQGALEIFGNLKNPFTGNKFKKDAKVLAKKEKGAQKYIDLGTELLSEVPKSKDKFDVMKFNAGEVMMKGGLKKQEELVSAKENLSMLQEVMLSDKENLKEMKKGGKIHAAKGATIDPEKPWEWRKTKKDKLDGKILEFVKLIEKKGIEGYSGEKSGYDKRNTTSGRASRHGMNQALDMIFKDPDIYDKVMKDPELSGYLYNSGLTAINEYDPKIKNKTGATVGHLHIGYDKGTKTSDQFRKDYKAAYKPKNSPILLPSLQTAPYKNASQTGDGYTENLWVPPTPVVTPPTKKPETEMPEAPNYEFVQPETKPYEARKNGLPWNQIAPAIPQIFDTPDYVEGQYYNPELKTPFQVSFQDRVNQNSKTFNGVATQGRVDANELSVLAAQQYSANDAVLADEFRTNQGISSSIANENIGILNDAKLRNIQLADTQYARQAQANANTQDRRIQAGIQIGDVLAKNSLENKTLDVTQQLYKNYAYDKNMQLQYVGEANGADRITDVPVPPSTTQVSSVDPNTNTKTTQTFKMPEFKPLEPADILRGFRKNHRKSTFKEGGKLTQGKIAKLMFS